MSKKFSVGKIEDGDKTIEIYAPDSTDLTIIVDYDDVPHDKVRREAKAMVKSLNQHLEEFRANAGVIR